MLFSYNKLKQMVDSKIKLSRMIEIMNNLGFEVEDTIQMPVLQGVKYGKVLNISKHPNADMLFICEIEFEDKNRKIIASKNDKIDNDTPLSRASLVNDFLSAMIQEYYFYGNHCLLNIRRCLRAMGTKKKIWLIFLQFGIKG